MAVVRRRPPIEPPPAPDWCEACRRQTTRREKRTVEGYQMELCVDPTDCLRHARETAALEQLAA